MERGGAVVAERDGEAGGLQRAKGGEACVHGLHCLWSRRRNHVGPLIIPARAEREREREREREEREERARERARE